MFFWEHQTPWRGQEWEHCPKNTPSMLKGSAGTQEKHSHAEAQHREVQS